MSKRQLATTAQPDAGASFANAFRFKHDKAALLVAASLMGFQGLLLIYYVFQYFAVQTPIPIKLLSIFLIILPHVSAVGILLQAYASIRKADYGLSDAC